MTGKLRFKFFNFKNLNFSFFNSKTLKKNYIDLENLISNHKTYFNWTKNLKSNQSKYLLSQDLLSHACIIKGENNFY